MNISKNLWCLYIGLPFVLSVHSAGAEEISEFVISSNVGITSDYISRGLRMNWGQPAIQAGVDISHQSGWYLGIWGSQISGDYYANGSLELDLYTGHRGTVRDTLNYDIGLGAYFYPGANYQNASPRGFYPSKHYDTVEASAGLTYEWFNLKYSLCLTDYFGYDDRTVPLSVWNSGVLGGVQTGQGTKGSSYLEANANFDLGDTYTIGLHAARQSVTHSSNLSYSDYKLSMTKYFSQNWSVMMAVTATQGAELYNNFLSISGNGRTKDIGGTHWQIGLNKAF